MSMTPYSTRTAVRQPWPAAKPAGQLVAYLSLLMIAALALACGLERDGSHAKSPESTPTASAGDAHGRYRTEAVRLGVSRPFFMLIDTATGRVERRVILGSQKFRPMTESPAPGANLEPKVPGRYEVKVVPGRRGSALLRLDTVTGQTWFFQLGANQKEWMDIDRAEEPDVESEAADRPASAPTPATKQRKTSATAPRQGSPVITDAPIPEGHVRNENELRGLREVLGDSSYDIQLRIWTAKHMAKLYPVEAAEMASQQLTEDDPRLIVAVADTAELDAEGRVRSAFEALSNHSDEKVVAAVAARIGGAP